MAQTVRHPIRDKVIAKITVAKDLQLHIKHTRADGLEMVNIRQFVPSSKAYGKGVVFETKFLPQVLEELQAFSSYLGQGGSREPGENQGVLFP